MRKIRAADLFCGAGGTSQGLTLAAAELGRGVELTAVNHWPTAIETHAANHPSARHLCETLDNIDPRKACGDNIDLLVASPECIHHSNARGGKPCEDQSRSTAWHVLRWADALRPRCILVENVREFMTWGPLGANGKPLKSKRGETFQAWLTALRSLGYRTDYRVLTCADYGDATTRERLFVQAVRGRKVIRWPEASHSPQGESTLFGQLPRWRSAREVIDWACKGTSIFNRKKPLSANTLKRIEAGLRRFGGEAFAIGQQSCAAARAASEPLPTVATAGAISLCQPFLVPTNYGERPGQAPRMHDVNAPVPTVVGTVSHAVVEPFLMHLTHQGGDRVNDIDRPIPTITTAKRGEQALIEPYLVKFYGTGSNVASVGDPLDAITTKDRFGLVTPLGVIDILFRMLQPHELAAAHSFPANYIFKGTKADVVKQIGNSVPARTARALILSALEAA